jgi:hypothetical protein
MQTKINSNKYLIRVLGYLLFSILSITSVEASHVMGADISYICNGTNNYTIELRVYRDCNGVSLGSSATVDLYSPACGSQSLTVSLLSNSPTVITPLCASTPDACNSSAGIYGVEEWVYTGNLTNLPLCNNWTMSWDLCCRNAVISTVGNPGSASTYVSASLDNTLCNSSPQFLTSPTPFICVGQPAYYSHGVSDPDGDSLVFNLVDCKRTASSTVSYLLPYSGSNPISTVSGFNIDPVSGAITFIPTINQVAIVCMQVEEYRNGLKIGEVTRDMQFSVLNCSNNLPTATGMDGTNVFQTTTCANQNVSFNINSNDVDLPNQSLSMFWNQGIAGASFLTNGASPPTGTFSWTPTINNIGTHIFTVTVADNACPITGLSSFNYVINVLPPANTLTVNFNKNDVTCNNACDGSATVLVSGGGGSYIYLWDNGEITPAATGLCPGTHYVVVAESGGCEDSFAVVINNPPILTLSSNTTDVSCYSFSDGYISINPSGGVVPYNYLWSNNGLNIATQNNLSAGTYQVTVTDAVGCSYLETIVVAQPNTLTSSLSATNIKCNNGNDGDIVATITGGTIPYNYFWDNGGGVSSSAIGLSNGNYNLTVTDANACTLTDGATITEPNALSSSISTIDVKCKGGNDGSASLTVLGGISPYTYQWSGGLGNTPSPGGISANSYQVTITDANGCTLIDNMTISEPNILTVSYSITHVLCNGNITGSIDLSVNGGIMPYTYQWSNNLGTSQDVSNLSAGSYGVVITDANNCTVNRSIIVSEPISLNISSDIIDLLCKNNSDGEIDITVAGGVQPYSFIWNDGVTLEDRIGLMAGNYAVTVTDPNGCQAILNNTVTEPTILTVSTPIITNVTCNGQNNGSLEVSVNGGTLPYTYTWSNGISTEDLVNIGAGGYFLTVTDANGCQVVTNATISEPSVLTASATATQQVSCNSGNDGEINLSVTGGTLPYVYSWNNGLGSIEDPINVSANTYIVTVTDANNCQITATVTITQPSQLLGTVTKTDVLCNGTNTGTATISVNGGTPNYIYSWSTFPVQTTSTATGLPGGTYFVTVTDGKNCTIINSVIITEPTLLVAAISSTSSNCYGGSNATISTSASGGVSPYTYNWSNGLGTSPNIINLPSGTFCVTVKDANGCTQIICETITEPTSMAIATSVVNNVSCNGGADGSVNINVTGGSPSYTYFWSNGSFSQNPIQLSSGKYYVTVQDANSCQTVDSIFVSEPQPINVTLINSTNPACQNGTNGVIDVSTTGGIAPYTYLWNTQETTQDISGLAQGSYTVTITDANNCQTIKPYVLTDPSALNASFSSTDVNCNNGSNGSITVSATGGTSGYTYRWNTTPLQITPTAFNLSATRYTVTITDANGCTYTDSTSITEPTAITIIANIQNVVCSGGNNGSIVLFPNGGTPGYTYQWSNNLGTSKDIFNLPSGNYCVTVTDANNCTKVECFTITQPLAISSSILILNNVSCHGGSDAGIDMTVTNGTGSYTYVWIPLNSLAEDPNQLNAGWHYATITDGNGCTYTDSIEITEPSALIANTSNIIPVSCNGNNDGNINISVGGGTQPYIFQWNNGSTTQNINNLLAGIYSLTVTDAKGCQVTLSATVTEPPVLTGTISKTNVSCNNGNDGTSTVTPVGGTAPYAYVWSTNPPQFNSTTTNLSAGIYYVTVTDIENCTTIDSITVTEPYLLTGVASVVQDVTCQGLNDGIAKVETQGGTFPYNYLWSNSATTSTIGNLSQGIYYVTVTDANNCSFVESIIITSPLSLTTTLVSKTDVSCNGDSDGSIQLNVTGGTASAVNGYNFTWNPPLGNIQSPNGLVAGIYGVTVTDNNGCQDNLNVTISEPTILQVTYTVSNILCNGGSNGAINVMVNGGIAPYTYIWSSGIGNVQNPTNLSAGTYNLTVTDLNNCEVVENIMIIEPTTLSAVITATDVTCHNGSDGNMVLAPQGGTLPYSYYWSINNTSTQNLNNISSGVYFVTITDANGCTFVTNTVVNEPTPITINITVLSNATCHSGSNGSIDVGVTGGGGQVYYYIWNTGQTTEDLINITAGNYIITISNNNGCTGIDSVFVTEPDSIEIATNVIQHVSCFGETNGSLSITASGGTLPYSYTWNNGATASNVSNLAAGTYIVTITDGNGCTQIDDFTITEPQLLDVTATITDVTCNGGNDGTATAIALGGTAPYSYFWSTIPAQVTPTAIGLSAGNYEVIITDINGCNDSITVLITQPLNAISATSSVTNVLCFGGQDGTTTVFPAGGVGSYTYIWSTTPTQTTATALNLSKGIYLVTITDANGCSYTHSTVVEEPNTLQVYSTVSNPSCNSLCDGSISIDSITGGTSPFSILFSNNSADLFINNLCPNTYTVFVQGANGCTYSDTFNVVTPDTLGVATQIAPPTCAGLVDGYINILPTGGTGPWTIIWSDGNTDFNRTALIAGDYTYTVTDVKGCTTTGSVSLIELSKIVVSTPASCFDKSDGTINIAAFGGYPPYLYSLNGQLQNSNSIDGLFSGDYLVEIQDSMGCIIDTLLFIDEPNPIEVYITADENISLGDSVELSVSSNFSFFDILWTISIGDTSNPVRCDTCFSTFVRPLYATTYQANVITSNGCNGSTEMTVDVDKLYRVFVANAFTPTASFGKNDFLFVQGDEMIVTGVLSFEVRDRGGSVVFLTNGMEINNRETGWSGYTDGESLQADTYVWNATIRFLDGTIKNFTGDVTLIK